MWNTIALPVMTNSQAQTLAQSYINQAHQLKINKHPELALFLYDQAKVLFKNIADTRQIAPTLSQVKNALSQARESEATEDKDLRQRIAEIYFERGKLFDKLGKPNKAQASYQKAQKWGYQAIEHAPIIPIASSSTLAFMRRLEKPAQAQLSHSKVQNSIYRDIKPGPSTRSVPPIANRTTVPIVSSSTPALIKRSGEPAQAQLSDSKAQDWIYKDIALGLSACSMSTLVNEASSQSAMPERPLVNLAAQEKIELVDYLFEKALSTLKSLEVSNKPSLFLVYAHHNTTHGEAKADTAKYIIKKLSQIQVNVYSDQTPMGLSCSSSPEDLQEDGKLEDILTSQLCLLPTQLRSDVAPVDKVIVCCSDVLGSYLTWNRYQDFYKALKEAYESDYEARSDSTYIRQVVYHFSSMDGFHHVLTEMAFLQIRAERLKDKHGIIPVSLTPKSSKQCLGHFILPTTVRMEDIPRFEEQIQAGQEVYPNQSQHWVLFKLIERILVRSDEAKPFLDRFWQGYSECIARLNKETSMVGAREFAKLIDSIFDEIQKELNRKLYSAVRQVQNPAWQQVPTQLLDKLRDVSKITEIVKKLLPPDFSLADLCEALYQHYQRSNLLIQRVSGQTASLENCYINLAIVESQAQREKNRQVLERQALAFQRLPSDEQIQATNYSGLVSLNGLFESQKLRDGSVGVPKRILIQGRAGIGKTTLCKKLVYDYQHHAKWKNHFESVLWIPLRQLKPLQLYSLDELLRRYYFTNQSARQASALAETLQQHKDHILFILDGLDEVVNELDEDHPLNLFLKELLDQTHVIVTSRPAGVDISLLRQIDLELETVGFTPEDAQLYVQTFARDSDQEAIQQFIDHTPLIQELVNIPVQLDALCYSWDTVQAWVEVGNAITVSALYRAMVGKLWRKDGKRLEKADAGRRLTTRQIDSLGTRQLEKRVIAIESEYLSYLAFRGLQQGQIEFDDSFLRKTFDELEAYHEQEDKAILPLALIDDLKKTSFLHTADVEYPDSAPQYHFLHLTFQEFFAAKFLAQHLQAYAVIIGKSKSTATLQAGRAHLGVSPTPEALKTFIAAYKYNPRYEIVWWMVAGLLEGKALELFFSLLQDAPHDLIGIRHQQVIINCLNEARAELNRFNQEIVTQLEQDLSQWICFELELNNGASKLGCQSAFPEHILLTSLSSLFAPQYKLIKTLGRRPILSNNAVQVLINCLKDYDEDNKLAAKKALILQQTLSESSVQALIDILEDSDKYVSEAGKNALTSQKVFSKSAIQVLVNALKENSQFVRQTAEKALISQKALSKSTIQALIGMLKDENFYVRETVQKVLVSQHILSKPAIEVLIDALKDDSPDVRRIVEKILVSQNTLSEPSIQALRGALKQGEDALEKQSTWQNLFPKLTLQNPMNVLKDKAKTASFRTINAVFFQNILSESGIQALVNLEGEDIEGAASDIVTTELFKQIGQLGIDSLKDDEWAGPSGMLEQKPLSEKDIQSLVKDLKKNKDLKSKAIQILSWQKELPEFAIQALIEVLKVHDQDVGFEAGRALSWQHTLSELAIHALAEVFKKGNKDARVAAARALSGQQTLPEPVIQILLIALENEDKRIRYEAARTLTRQKVASELAIQFLVENFNHANQDIKHDTLRTLNKQNALLEPTIEALIRVLKNENESVMVRTHAITVLGDQEALSESAMQALIWALNNGNAFVKTVAANALREQKTLPTTAIQALIEVLIDHNEDIQIHELSTRIALTNPRLHALLNDLKEDYMNVNSSVVKQTMKEFMELMRPSSSLADGLLNTTSSQVNLMVDVLAFFAILMQNRLQNAKLAAANTLSLHLDQLYSVLPNCTTDQIDTLYTAVFLSSNFRQVHALTVEDHQLFFYTTTGLRKQIDLTPEQIESMTKVFTEIQEKIETACLRNRAWNFNKKDTVRYNMIMQLNETLKSLVR